MYEIGTGILGENNLPYRLFEKIFFSQYGRFYEKTEFV